MNVVQLHPTALNGERYLTRRQVAEHYGVHVNTVDNWIRKGCPSHTWGQRMRRLRISEVEAWLNQ